jgi:hypothetical protein
MVLASGKSAYVVILLQMAQRRVEKRSLLWAVFGAKSDVKKPVDECA